MAGERGLKRLAVTRIDPTVLEHPPDVKADVSIPADRTLYDDFSEMLIHHAASIAVVDDGRVLGVLTPRWRDRIIIAQPGDERPRTRIDERWSH